MADDWWDLNEKPRPTQSDLGGVGLMQMPTGRVADEGEFSFNYYDNDQYRRFSMALQLFPWLETSIRYVDTRTRLYGRPSFSGQQTNKDRGINAKIRLWEENYWLPEVSFGMRDLAGTGKFSGEFLAGTKRFGPLDLTLGVGWGYLAKRGNISNPFCDLKESFCDRGDLRDFRGEGGKLATDKWFRGDAAIFGGLEYQTPWEPLKVKVEFDGNNYQDEFGGNTITQDSPWNYGLHYSLNDNIKLKVSYERGNTWMFGVTARLNFNTVSQVKLDEPPQVVKAKNGVEKIPESSEELRVELVKSSGFYTRKIGMADNERRITLYGTQARYRDDEKSIDRIARVVLNHVPESVKTVDIVERNRNFDLKTIEVDTEKYRTMALNRDLTTEFKDAISIEEPKLNSDKWWYNPLFEVGAPTYGLKPQLQQSIGGPENFYMYQLSAQNAFSWSLSDSFNIYGRVNVNLLTNFDDFNFLVDGYDSPLPRVRTYVREYVTHSDVWVSALQATYTKQLNEDWYTSVYGGYLERMFGGIGGEVLYRPIDSRWAFGANIVRAKQRSFESHMGFRDYEVTTGHLTAYWHTPYLDNTLISVSAGRFLAKDKGVQFNFEHEFDSGIIAGAYAAFTDVSSEDFGEGSFTKGFYIEIPFDLFSVKPSRVKGPISWSPITRDGGQMIGRFNSLYDLTEKRSSY